VIGTRPVQIGTREGMISQLTWTQERHGWSTDLDTGVDTAEAGAVAFGQSLYRHWDETGGDRHQGKAWLVN